jgi:uncharacterized membrane protein (DUF4010 family)
MEDYIINTDQFQLTQMEFLLRLLVACGIGFLVGLEREHKALEQNEEAFAGIRTYILLALLGFVGAGLNYLFGPWMLPLIVFSVIALTAISYWVTASKGNIGGTAELTTILVVLLGTLTFHGELLISSMIAVLLVVLLSAKLKLQNVIEKISGEEMYDFLRFVVIALLLFPFLPDETYGPYDVLNPKEIGWVILLTSGLGLVGYIMMRVFGTHKGILLTGIVGGFVSSTAVTWVFSKRSKEHPALSVHCAIAILAASSIMILRVGIWVFVFNPKLMETLLVPIIIMFVAAISVPIILFIRNKQNKQTETEMPPGKPLNLKGALIFGLIYTFILFAVAYANSIYGERGIFIASGIAGLTDVDAITISVSRLAGQSIELLSAQFAIIIATVSNTIVKAGIAMWSGSKEMRKYILLGYGVVFVAALIGVGILSIS